MAIETVIQPTEDVLGCESVSGNQVAILKATGIDIREFSQVMDGSGVAVVVKDGHQWTITPWDGGGGFAVAARPQTEEETERDRLRVLRSTTCPHFSKDRLLMCVDISERVVQLLAQMSPEHPPTRAVRRNIRRKLDRLAQMQLELLCNRNADADLFEQELKHLHA